MGTYAEEVREFIGTDGDGDERPLGERLRGLAGELEVDSVEAVRELRERR